MYKKRRIAKTKRRYQSRVPRMIGTAQYTQMKSSANYGIRRSFQMVKSLTTALDGVDGQQKFFHHKLDLSAQLTNCPEFADAVKAYKCFNIKNVRVNIHNFLTVPMNYNFESNTKGVFPIALAYQGIKGNSYKDPNTDNVSSTATFDSQTLVGYAQVLGRSHSKLISFSPDSFSTSIINTNGKTKEDITVNGTTGAVSVAADNHGYLTVYYGVNGLAKAGAQLATLQIIFDVVVFDQ